MAREPLQTHSAESSSPVFRGERGLTPKAFIIAMLLIPLNVFWIIQLEVVRYTHPTLIHPLSNVIFIIFWLMVLSAVLGKIIIDTATDTTGIAHNLRHVVHRFFPLFARYDGDPGHYTRTSVSVRNIRE